MNRSGWIEPIAFVVWVYFVIAFAALLSGTSVENCTKAFPTRMSYVFPTFALGVWLAEDLTVECEK